MSAKLSNEIFGLGPRWSHTNFSVSRCMVFGIFPSKSCKQNKIIRGYEATTAGSVFFSQNAIADRTFLLLVFAILYPKDNFS